MKLLSLRLKTFENVTISSNVNQRCPTRRHKSEYKNLGLTWLSTVKISRSCCIKSLNHLRMISLITKEEQGVRTLVVTLFNHLSSIFKFPWVAFTLWIFFQIVRSRGGSRAAATSKMERFVIKVNGSKPLTVITKRSTLDVAAALDPPLEIIFWKKVLLTDNYANKLFPTETPWSGASTWR